MGQSNVTSRKFRGMLMSAKYKLFKSETISSTKSLSLILLAAKNGIAITFFLTIPYAMAIRHLSMSHSAPLFLYARQESFVITFSSLGFLACSLVSYLLRRNRISSEALQVAHGQLIFTYRQFKRNLSIDLPKQLRITQYGLLETKVDWNSTLGIKASVTLPPFTTSEITSLVKFPKDAGHSAKLLNRSYSLHSLKYLLCACVGGVIVYKIFIFTVGVVSAL